MKKTLILLLALTVFAMIFSSCGNSDTGETDSPADSLPSVTQAAGSVAEITTEAVIPENSVVICANGVSEYKVIRPEFGSNLEISSAVSLKKAIESNFSCEMSIGDDWIIRGETAPETACEILIGDTNRAETKEAVSQLGNFSYIIMVKNQRVVICGSNDIMTSLAVGYFTDQFVLSKKGVLAIPDDYIYIYTSSSDDGTIITYEGTTLYNLVYTSNGNRYPAIELMNAFKRFTGAEIKTVSDTTKAEDLEVIVGNVNRENVRKDLDKNAYGYEFKDGKLYLYGGSDKALYYSVQHFVENYMKNCENKNLVLSEGLAFSGVLSGYSNDSWELYIPEFEGGTRCNKLYDCGSGLMDDSNAKPTIEDSYMYVIDKAGSAKYDAYLEKLEKFGYTREFYNTIDSNVYARYVFGNSIVYTYYLGTDKSVRVIEDRSSNAYMDEICKTLAPGAGGKTEFYQYSIDYTKGSESDTNAINCGMFYIIKLPDNSLIMIDGGHNRQASNAALAGMDKFLYEITGTPDDQPLHIAAWYITHPDGDHVTILFRLCQYMRSKAHGMPIIDSFIFNFPSVQYMSQAGECKTMREFVSKSYPNSKYLKIFTGMKFSFCGVDMDVYYTNDAAYSTQGELRVSSTNDACALVDFKFDGFKVMMLGDNNTSAQNIVLSMYKAQTLKSDAVQAAHHSFNNVTNYYKTINAPIVFVPQSRVNALTTKGYTGYMTYAGYKPDDPKQKSVYFGDEYTYKLEIVNGKPVVTGLPRYDAK